jgi:hypothetical protein
MSNFDEYCIILEFKIQTYYYGIKKYVDICDKVGKLLYLH